MKTGSNLKFNDQYEYLTFDLDQEFLLGELKGEEIRDKMISVLTDYNTSSLNLDSMMSATV
jgi:hypothetical protein